MGRGCRQLGVDIGSWLLGLCVVIVSGLFFFACGRSVGAELSVELEKRASLGWSIISVSSIEVIIILLVIVIIRLRGQHSGLNL
jgi:hypothetical protein